jgi:transglutaminase/protease-like cytokinesis protein 3
MKITLSLLSLLFFISDLNAQLPKALPDLQKTVETPMFAKVQSLQQLSTAISSVTQDPGEKLQLLLHWAYEYIGIDEDRFFNGGIPLSIDSVLSKRMGLCNEFANLLGAFCEENRIAYFNIEGYVKEADFNPGKPFNQTNHKWNAVFIDSSWYVCDLFWSVSELEIDNASGKMKFIKKLSPEYFLADPNTFITTHLPADPVFQFSHYPLSIKQFKLLDSGKDTLGEAFFNFENSIREYRKLNKVAEEMRVARNSYRFNKDNPNLLISEYYNQGVALYNNSSKSKQNLRQAEAYFKLAVQLIPKSDVEDIKGLKPSCEKALSYIERKLK